MGRQMTGIVRHKVEQGFKEGIVGLLTLKKEQTFGLDIGATGVKVIQLNKTSSGHTVTHAARVPLPPEGIADPQGHSDAVLEAIRDSLHQSRVHARHAVGGVGGQHVRLHGFRFPGLTRQELEQAVLLEAEQIGSSDSQDCLVSYDLWEDEDATPSSPDAAGNRNAGILAAASRKITLRKQQLIQQASVNCALMDVDALAVLNVYTARRAPQEKGRTAILNLDYRHGNVIITEKGQLPFFRDFSYGGDAILEHVARETEDSPDNLWDILMNPSESTESSLNLTITLARACQKLISDLMETIRFYYIQHKGEEIQRLLLCGDFAEMPNLADVLREHLPVAVELWNPLEGMTLNVPSKTKAVLEQHGPGFAVAAGLAMREL